MSRPVFSTPRVSGVALGVEAEGSPCQGHPRQACTGHAHPRAQGHLRRSAACRVDTGFGADVPRGHLAVTVGLAEPQGPPGLRHPLLCPWTVQSSSQSSRGKTLHNLKASPLPKLLTTVSLGEAVCPGQREGQILGPQLRGPGTSHVIPFSWNPVPTFYALVTAVSLAFYTCHACGSFIF